jgi:hypothetical protein
MPVVAEEAIRTSEAMDSRRVLVALVVAAMAASMMLGRTVSTGPVAEVAEVVRTSAAVMAGLVS